MSMHSDDDVQVYAVEVLPNGRHHQRRIPLDEYFPDVEEEDFPKGRECPFTAGQKVILDRRHKKDWPLHIDLDDAALLLHDGATVKDITPWPINGEGSQELGGVIYQLGFEETPIEMPDYICKLKEG